MRALGVAGRPELERGLEESPRRSEALQAGGPVACVHEGGAGPTFEVGGRRPARARIFERPLVVVGAGLGVILVTAERLDPLGGLAMLLGAAAPRYPPVGDVEQEEVAERVLGFALDRRGPLPADELLPLERAKALVQAPARKASEVRDGSEPEHPADDGRVLQHGFFLGIECVEPGRDQALHRRGDRQLVGCGAAVALGEHADELLGVERVAACTGEKGRLQARRQHGPLEELLEKLRRLLVGQGRERDGQGVRLPAAPARPAHEELGASGADDEHRHCGRPFGEVVDEVEQALVRPVEVLEQEHGRSLLRDCLEEPAPGREVLGVIRAVVARPRKADKRAQVRLDPAGVLLARDEIENLSPQRAFDLARRIGLQDARLCLDHLRERPEGHPLAVRETAASAPRDELGVVLDDGRELEDEPRLADPRRADECDELRGVLVPGPGEGIAEKLHLGGTADERSAAALSRIGADPRARADGLPGEDRLCLALGAYRLECQVLDRARGREVRCLADEDAVDGRGLLEARCDVHEVRDEPLAFPRADLGFEERLTRRHADPDGELCALRSLGEIGDSVPDLERRPHGSLGVVFVGDRCAEDGHHGVADELLDRPAEVLDVPAKPGVERLEEPAHVLGVEPVCERREADEIGEEHGHGTPLGRSLDAARLR